MAWKCPVWVSFVCLLRGASISPAASREKKKKLLKTEKRRTRSDINLRGGGEKERKME